MSEVRVDADVAAAVGLSERQRDVLVGIAGGNTNAVIGRKLGLSENVVKRSVSLMMRLLGASDRAHLVVVAIAAGVLTVPVAPGRGWRIPERLTRPYVLACGCGRGLTPGGMRRLTPPRSSVAGSVTVLPIVCPGCAEAGGVRRRAG